ncbi:FAD-binding oxidoreductase [Falsiroseomonas sp. CW058]|uniref:FAD-binding oxidoreductase n=1 Tax=Falsiroseomonas sp. CW058 TaxID=3388664 RepID=UPI003D311901
MTDLAARLGALLGAAHVGTDAAARALATADIFPDPRAVPAEIVIRPGSTEEAAAALRLVAEAGRAVVPRGAGLSYTGGVVARVPAVVVDTSRLDAIRIDAANLTAVVGAGASWQSVADALAAQGLRSAQPSPISGAVTTVGATAAQHLPGSMEGILGLAVVLADGEVVRTGALSLRDGPPFWRYMGPDLTGIFLGDCGAFGVKTEVAIRLVAERPAAFASFAFETADAALAVLTDVVRRGLVVRALGMDPVRGKGAAKVEAGEALRTAGAVAARAGGVLRAVRDVANLARGAAQLAEPAWSLHLTSDGATEAGAEAAIAAARALALAQGGREIAPTVPQALRARPYSIRGMVGPEGERWVPVHGVFPLGAAREGMHALQACLEARRAGLEAAGVSVSFLLSSLAAYCTIEPMFYWRDALDPLHLKHLSEKNRARFGAFPPNPAAREAVAEARAALTAVMDAHGAVHAQIGRYYALADRMEPGAAALLARVKAMLDPAGRMNPGALHLGEG